MDFLSIILSAIGWGRDRAARFNDQKTEAYRLNSEVAGECLRVINVLGFSTPALIRRLQALYPEQTDAYKNVTETLAALQLQSQQLYKMAEDNKVAIEKASSRSNWEKGLRASHEWRATASALGPYVDGVIKQIEEAVSGEEARRAAAPNRPPPPIPATKDRGWDAPPL